MTHGSVSGDIWTSDDAALFTVLFETQVLLMAMSGMPVSDVARSLHENDSTLWRMPDRLVEKDLRHATRVIDRFHIMQTANRQLDLVRVKESKESEEKRRLLSRTKFIWLENEENLTEKQTQRKEKPCKEKLKTGRAYTMVQTLRNIYGCEDRQDATSRLDFLVSWMMHSDRGQMEVVGRMSRNDREEMPDCFDERLTNAKLEGMNSVILATKRAARGFTNPGYFKTMIYLKLGKLPRIASMCATHTN